MEREVEVKLKMAEIFVDFLDFINMPKHWYIIKEFGIYNGVSGTGHSTTLETILRRCDEKYKNDLKTILYTNIVLNTSGKLVDIVSKLISSDLIVQYVRHTRNLANDFKEQLDTVPYSNMDELRTLINMNGDIKQELTQLLDESFLKHKKNEVHSQPSKNVSKAISMIKTIDEGVIDKLTEKETADLKQNIAKLTEQINKYSEKLDLPVIGIQNNQNEPIIPESNECLIKKNYTVDLKYIVPTVRISNCLINSLYKTLVFDVDFEFVGFFVDSNGRKVSNDFIVNKNTNTVDVELQSSISSEKQCFLIIKHPEAIETCISQVIPFQVSMMFVSKFDF